MRNIIKTLREEHGLLQADVAERIGLTRAAYSNYEQGIREPSIDIIKKLCQVYNVSADELLGLVEYGEKGAFLYNLDENEAEIIRKYRLLSQKRKRSLETAAGTLIIMDEKERLKNENKA